MRAGGRETSDGPHAQREKEVLPQMNTDERRWCSGVESNDGLHAQRRKEQEAQMDADERRWWILS